jgi:hypothetical protein
MNTDQLPESATAFPQMVSVALGRLKERLQENYQQAYPDLGDIIHLLLDVEEAKARELSSFPHLFLPDLVEASIAILRMVPAETRHERIAVSPDFATTEAPQTGLALCG